MEKIGELSWKYYIKTWLYNWSEIKVPLDYMVNDAKYIDYYGNNKELASKNIEYSNNNAFVISVLDSSNKYSKNYLNCTWVVAIWESKKTSQNISFLSHQNVASFLKNKQWLDLEFKEKLIKSLVELVKESKKWTIDIIILWWNDLDEYKEYWDTIKFLDEIISGVLGFSATVVWWPSVNNVTWRKNNKDIVVNTEKRLVYLFKEYWEPADNVNFVANKINEIIENKLKTGNYKDFLD